MYGHFASQPAAIFPGNGAAIGGAQDQGHVSENSPSRSCGAASVIS
jgi:hypothetical protein